LFGKRHLLDELSKAAEKGFNVLEVSVHSGPDLMAP
jgi:hypothetical protein